MKLIKTAGDRLLSGTVEKMTLKEYLERAKKDKSRT